MDSFMFMDVSWIDGVFAFLLAPFVVATGLALTMVCVIAITALINMPLLMARKAAARKSLSRPVKPRPENHLKPHAGRVSLLV